jgi:hypothetical protein
LSAKGTNDFEDSTPPRRLQLKMALLRVGIDSGCGGMDDPLFSGVCGGMVRDMMLEAIEKRFANLRGVRHG